MTALAPARAPRPPDLEGSVEAGLRASFEGLSVAGFVVVSPGTVSFESISAFYRVIGLDTLHTVCNVGFPGTLNLGGTYRSMVLR
jgi:hypothetical protein